MLAITTSRPILETLTDRELYRLSFEISEVLVKRQQTGLWDELGQRMAENHDNAFVPCAECCAADVDPDFKGADGRSVCDDCRDNADDRYGAW